MCSSRLENVMGYDVAGDRASCKVADKMAAILDFTQKYKL